MGGTSGIDTGGTGGVSTGGIGGTSTGGIGGAIIGGSGGIGSGGRGGASAGGSGGTSAGRTGGTATGGTGGIVSGGTTAGGAGGIRTGGTGGVATGGAGGTAIGGTTATGGSTSPGDAAVPDVRPPTDLPPVEVAPPPDRAIDLPAVPDLVPDLPQVPDAPPDGPAPIPGLLLYYSCEQANGTTLPDMSGNGRDGTLVGPTSIAAGKVGNALVLTANNVDSGTSGGYVVMPAALLSTSSAMTIATWFKTNSILEFQRVFDLGGTGGSTSSMYLTTRYTTGNLHFTIRITLADGGLSREDIDAAGTVIPTGVWEHVAVVLDASGGRLYLNGVLVGTNTTMVMRPPILGATPNDWIGRSQFAVNPYLDGAIDEFRVYNRGLSAAEVLALYTGH